MHDAHRPRTLSPRQARWLLNLYPPFLFNRIRVRDVAPDFRRFRLEVAKSLVTRNLNGTTFGGSIYSAADPIYALMYWQIFAHRGQALRVWTRTATIRFLRPAASRLTLEFRIPENELDEVTALLDGDGREPVTRTYATAAVDAEGRTCAQIETEIYLRRRGPREGNGP